MKYLATIALVAAFAGAAYADG
ncbi:MAG: hypothetical protein H6Q33_4306, partial [Deltaproteobacteria bacterium]|nr:hypothetical protein [Deltaproteobacteria bacterium]